MKTNKQHFTMKTVISMMALMLSLSLSAQSVPGLTLTNHTGLSTLTCYTPSIKMSCADNFSATNVTWICTGATLSGGSVTLTTPGNYTVTATGGSVSATQTFAIFNGTTLPTVNLTPLSQIVSCSLTSIQTVTASSNLFPVEHRFSTPNGGVANTTANPTTYLPVGGGVFGYTLVNITTGCSTTAQFTVLTSYQHPTFTLTSNRNYSVGCAPKNFVQVSVTSVTSAGVPSYTLLAPGSSTVVPNAFLSSQSIYNIYTPGTWTVVVRDNSNTCQSRVPFTVVQNTLSPSVSVSSAGNTLTCSSPSVVLSASSNAMSNYFWSYSTSTLSGASLPAFTNTSAPSKGLINTYTLLVTDTLNACTTQTVFSLYQDIVTPTLNIAPVWTLDCATLSVLVAPTNVNLSYSFSWNPGSVLTPSILITAPGNYSLNVVNPSNGCKISSTVTVNACVDTGIEQYAPSLNSAPVYYDLMGNLIAKRYNEVIIEKLDNRMRKIIISQY